MMNSLFWTDPSKPDPDPLPEVTMFNILVRPYPNLEQGKTKGGVLLPDQTLEDLDFARAVARVVAIGPLCFRREDFLIDGKVVPWCQVGDWVLFNKFVGDKIVYDGVRFLLVHDDQIRLVLDDPRKICE